jgi:guanine deaminase
VIVYRGRLFSPLSDPFVAGDVAPTFLSHEKGYLAIEDGRIVSVGDWSDAPPDVREAAQIVDFGERSLISPGFVDCHLHGPQLEMIGSYGGHLLEWLNRYTFPTEMKFSDPDYARRVAAGLFEELLRNGSLAALLFSTVHTEATEIFFEEAERAGVRAIIGKALMDRNAPPALLESASVSHDAVRRLIMKWHGRGHLDYAISPRFAPAATEALLEMSGALKQEFPDAYVHTHVAESLSEVFWVKQLFPLAANYVDVYDQAGLLGPKSVLAHGVHLSESELRRLAETETRICHCPNSNLFLGSGLFPLKTVLRFGVKVGLGSDIGAGTTTSMFNAMADAYKVQQVQGVSLSPFHLWYLATLGGAVTLSLDDRIGSLKTGKEADFLVLDLDATPLISRRTQVAEGMEDILAGLVFLGDDRVVMKGFVAGKEIYTRSTL